MKDAHNPPLGYWLRTVDALISERFASAFDDEEIGRREWMLLNALSGDMSPQLAERLAHRGKKLKHLQDRGWIEASNGTWTLTNEGRAAKERLGEKVGAIRAEVTAAVGDEEYAAMTASLETIARSLGWSEEDGPRRFGRRGFGFGPRRGFGHGGGFGHGHHGRVFGHGDAGPGIDAERPEEFGPRGFGAHRHPGFGPDCHRHHDGGGERHGHGEPTSREA